MTVEAEQEESSTLLTDTSTVPVGNSLLTLLQLCLQSQSEENTIPTDKTEAAGIEPHLTAYTSEGPRGVKPR